MANQFADAQLALRGAGSVFALMVARHKIKSSKFVMPGLVPGIHVLKPAKNETWMARRQDVHVRLRRTMPGHDAVRATAAPTPRDSTRSRRPPACPGSPRRPCRIPGPPVPRAHRP